MLYIIHAMIKTYSLPTCVAVGVLDVICLNVLFKFLIFSNVNIVCITLQYVKYMYRPTLTMWMYNVNMQERMLVYWTLSYIVLHKYWERLSEARCSDVAGAAASHPCCLHVHIHVHALAVWKTIEFTAVMHSNMYASFYCHWNHGVNWQTRRSVEKWRKSQLYWNLQLSVVMVGLLC